MRTSIVLCMPVLPVSLMACHSKSAVACGAERTQRGHTLLHSSEEDLRNLANSRKHDCSNF